MHESGRWSGPALGRYRKALLLILLLPAILLMVAGPAASREVVVTGSKMNRFGRILLQFDQPTKVSVKVSNSVLVISFADTAKIKTEKLATELAPYITTVRRDPDGTGLRIALVGPVRPNLLEAAERVFVDLLPMNWTGMAPSLPPEVLGELAERVKAAEAKLKTAELRRPEARKAVRLRMGELPTLTRLGFEAPPDTNIRVKEAGDEVEVAFDGPLTFESGGAKPKLAVGVSGFEATAAENALTIRVKRAPGFKIHTFREGDAIVVDVAKPQPAQVLPDPPPPPARVEAVPPAGEPPLPPGRAAASGQVGVPLANAAQGPRPNSKTVEIPVPEPAAAPRLPPGIVSARVEAGPDGASILFPFRARTPAAAFLRSGALTLLFDSPDRIDTGALGTAEKGMKPLDVRTENGVTILRFPEPPSGSARLLMAGDGWRLSFGNGAGLPADALKVSRALDESGRALVRVALVDAAKAHWLKDLDGARLAVVTASGRVQGLSLPRNFVEFGIAATLHGVVVEARADDVAVGLGQGGVTVTRESGLALSPVARGQEDGGAASRLVLTRDVWVNDVAPGVYDRNNAYIWDSAHAARSGRGEARFRLARFLIANGFNHEAANVLALARSEDPAFARRRETLLLSGIAAARAGHTAQARRFLTAEQLGDEPEALLWRAVIDASEGRWPQALAGFRRSTEVVELYPDDLAGPVRLLALSAALEGGDVARGESELVALDRMTTGAVPRDSHDLARARVDQAAGRVEAAYKAYEKLIEEGALPVSSEATLRWVKLGLETKAMDAATAIDRLERLSVIWRGGRTEIGTVAELARLYGEARRWRDMFAMARRAERHFPNNPTTRALLDDAARLLEGLMLSPEGSKLSAVQALSLYFDFRELAPIGRRGDEIVRRLADRLVELDLIEQAAELLQYQIDKRLTGAARATVAARLAAIRLISSKPLLALSALHSTRMAELPVEVHRYRYMLEARAQADLARTDLALEIIEDETAPEFARLRTSILWTARRWREAGEAGEALLGTRWDGPEPLTERERGDLLRAAIAYALADEQISLDRVKQKFGRKILDSPDAKTFDLIVRPGGVQTREFRAAALESTKGDSLRLLLADWRGRVLEVPAEPEPAEKPSGDVPASGAAAPRAETADPAARG